MLIMGDFNLQPSEESMENFIETYDLYNLIKEPTCFKSNPAKCYDLILTNKKYSFISTKTIETGLSDFHKLTITTLKTEFVKGEPKIVKYRDYKNFNCTDFNRELEINLQKINNEYNTFSNIMLNVLNKHAPVKCKMIRANNAPFMNKEVRKIIMARSRGKNKYNKNRTPENWEEYRLLRNKCVQAVKETKKNYFKNLDINFTSDCKNFWKTIKPAFTDKGKTHNKIILVEEGEIISESKQITEIMNEYFINITKTLDIPQ